MTFGLGGLPAFRRSDGKLATPDDLGPTRHNAHVSNALPQTQEAPSDGGAVLIIGAYGSGKSSIAMEMADIIEQRPLPYALLDLDFLGWYGTPSSDSHTDPSVLLRNLSAVVANYRDAGVRYFIVAGTVSDAAEVKGIRDTLPVALRVVRLTLSLEATTRRLGTDPTSGRANDLRQAAAQIASSIGAGFEDLTVSNDRPLREVANEILAWLAW